MADEETCRVTLVKIQRELENGCGGVSSIGTNLVYLPPDVSKWVFNHNSKQEAIKYVAESEWAQNWAREMCEFVEGKATEECIDRLSKRAAEEVV